MTAAQQLEMLAREYVRANHLTLHEKLLLSHFVAQLKQHTQDAVQPTAAATDDTRGLTLVR